MTESKGFVYWKTNLKPTQQSNAAKTNGSNKQAVKNKLTICSILPLYLWSPSVLQNLSLFPPPWFVSFSEILNKLVLRCFSVCAIFPKLVEFTHGRPCSHAKSNCNVTGPIIQFDGSVHGYVKCEHTLSLGMSCSHGDGLHLGQTSRMGSIATSDYVYT